MIENLVTSENIKREEKYPINNHYSGVSAVYLGSLSQYADI